MSLKWKRILDFSPFYYCFKILYRKITSLVPKLSKLNLLFILSGSHYPSHFNGMEPREVGQASQECMFHSGTKFARISLLVLPSGQYSQTWSTDIAVGMYNGTTTLKIALAAFIMQLNTFSLQPSISGYLLEKTETISLCKNFNKNIHSNLTMF